MYEKVDVDTVIYDAVMDVDLCNQLIKPNLNKNAKRQDPRLNHFCTMYIKNYIYWNQTSTERTTDKRRNGLQKTHNQAHGHLP